MGRVKDAELFTLIKNFLTTNWVERSQCYLCRTFDSLNKGENYINVRPAVQIGILDYTLFPEAPEFYATYRLMNVKSHKIYSDKLRISVLDLKHIELATEEDKAYRIDHWACFFKAVTWKELKALTAQNPIFTDAAKTAVVLSEDEKIRLQCEAREDYYRRTGWKDEYIEQLTSENEQLNSENKQLNSENEQLNSKNEQLNSKNEQLTSTNEQLTFTNEQLTSKNEQLTSENQRLYQLLKEAGISVAQGN